MTDIVERLRICAGGPGDAHTFVICRLTRDTARDAAAEIEWLRGERNRLAADLAKAHREALTWMDKAAARRGQIEIILEMFDRRYPYDDIAAEARALLTEGGR